MVPCLHQPSPILCLYTLIAQAVPLVFTVEQLAPADHYPRAISRRPRVPHLVPVVQRCTVSAAVLLPPVVEQLPALVPQLLEIEQVLLPAVHQF